MDSMSSMMGWAGTIALAIVLSAAAGLRAWLPLFAAGLLGRIGFAQLGEGFAWLESTPAIVLFGVATVLEMIGDKVPVVDHALDAVGTVVRPLAGALVAAAVMYRIDNPMLAGVAGLVVGAPTAFAPHAVKASARGASSVTTMGMGNPVLSVGEDMLAIHLTVLGFLLPIAGVLLLAFAFWFAVRWLRRRRRSRARSVAPQVAG